MTMIICAEKSDKKDIKRFYKQQKYNARFLGDDACYFIKDNEQIIACVIISYQHRSPFLHGLCVDGTHRHQGIARQLLTHCQHLHQHIYCFAQDSLAGLYLNSHFSQVSQDTLPNSLQTRFTSYLRKQTNLVAFYHQSNS
ncbi:GNAT family N-acetyltransferase [Thalassotalea maritima]|uniref:GNAT family N-acetyltransferase n=1 Tax=Thalassotalea maritima TaxID=3242416 RepID=UPI0035288358